MLSSVTKGLLVHDVCNQIVTRLKARGWQAPGIEVRHEESIDGGRVSNLPNVYGEEFCIDFGVWRKELFPRRLVIPGTEINICPSLSSWSLTVNRYAYTNWQRDKRWFIGTDVKNHGRRNGSVRYLRYESTCDCDELNGAIFGGVALIAAYMRGEDESPPRDTLHAHADWRCPLLVFSDPYKTEYEPVRGEPVTLRTDEVLREAKEWLEKHLLPTL